MNTPDRRTPVLTVDCDIHPTLSDRRAADFLTEPWRTRFLSGNKGAGGIGVWNPNGVRRADARLPDGAFIDESAQTLGAHFLDHYDIAFGVLNPGSLGRALTPEPDYAAAMTAATNDVVAHDWLPADARLRASILVSPVDPHLAAREIERWAGHSGFVQVLMPAAAAMPYGNRFYHPIYAAAEKQNLPVAIHPGAEGTGIAGAPTPTGYTNGYLEWHTGLMTGYVSHLISLVTEGVFQKFPGLRWVLIEGGVAWLPPLLWRFDKNWKALRLTAPWLTRPPSEIVADHVFLSTQPIEEPDDIEHFRTIMGMFPADKMVMFSSDYPHWDGDTPDFCARAFPKDLRARVLHETARELYRLPAPTEAAHAG